MAIGYFIRVIACVCFILPAAFAAEQDPPLLSNTSTEQSQTNLTAVIISLSGAVSIRQPESLEWNDAEVGDEVSAGTQIMTGEDAQLKILLSNGNAFYFRRACVFTIDEISENGEGKYTNIFSLNRGKAKFDVVDSVNLGKFEVHTPTAVAGVRGTVLFMDVTAQATELYVEIGKAYIENIQSGRREEVGEGLFIEADMKGAISPPKPPPPEKKLLSCQLQ